MIPTDADDFGDGDLFEMTEVLAHTDLRLLRAHGRGFTHVRRFIGKARPRSLVPEIVRLLPRLLGLCEVALAIRARGGALPGGAS